MGCPDSVGHHNNSPTPTMANGSPPRGPGPMQRGPGPGPSTAARPGGKFSPGRNRPRPAAPECSSRRRSALLKATAATAATATAAQTAAAEATSNGRRSWADLSSLSEAEKAKILSGTAPAQDMDEVSH
ncbi:hypothetical protein TNIN_273441 [Trichonephila inaurata madagascariensis]|uniref:Uncharacterized protein n=1 Tax=Trichonephila inaurata madagascariensis TaxID=2747483 RepID=A0A8X6WRV7_9ARAC|nr:hypothetical protein TNIN_273441 [Trichonephila inaurata madagascariensis]